MDQSLDRSSGGSPGTPPAYGSSVAAGGRPALGARLIGGAAAARLGRVILLSGLVLSGLTCDAFQPPTDLELAVVVGVSGDSIVSLKQTVRFNAAAATSAGSAPGAAFRWRSTAPAIATVDTTGAVTGRARGRAWIVAQLVSPDFPSGGPEDSAQVWVRFDAIALSRDTATLTAIGDTLIVEARGVDALGVDAGAAGAVWSTSNDSIAAVTPEGAIIARRPGVAIITARADSLDATAQVTVRQVAAHVTFTSLRNDSLLFDALQVDSVVAVRVTDRRNAVMAGPSITWTSSRPTVVAVQDAAAGRMRALLPDTATLTARVDTASSNIRVRISQIVTAVALTPDTLPTDAVSDTLQLTAVLLDRNARAVSGRTITWTSRDTAVAVVNASGRVVSRGNGVTRIVASNAGVADSTPVVVSQVATQVALAPSSKTLLALGDTATLAATLRDRRSSLVAGQRPVWSTSDAAVVTVDTLGRVTAVAEGRAEIRATVGAIVGSATVLVGVPALVAAPDTTLVLDAVNDTVALPAAAVLSGRPDTLPGLEITWQSRDETIVVALSGGRLATKANGSTYVVASYGSLRDSIAVQVAQVVRSVGVSPSPVNFSALGDTTRLVATPHDGRGTTVAGRSVAWSSADASIVSIDGASGLAQAVANGSTTLSAVVDGVTGQATANVSQAIAAIDVRPDTATLLAAGATAAFAVSAIDARGNPVTGAGISYDWDATPGSVLTVSPTQGTTVTATAQGFGVGYVRVWGGGRVDSSRVLVTPVYGSVAVAPGTATLTAINDTVRLAATVTDQGGQPVAAPLLSWTSSDTSVARVNQVGRVTARKDGTAVITVNGGTRQATAAVTVRQAAVGVDNRGLPFEQEFRAAGDTVRYRARAWDRNGYAIPRLDDSVRWRIDANDQVNAPYVFHVDSVTGLVTALGFPPLQNWWCGSCYNYGLSIFATVSGQQWQTWANFYPRIHRVDVQPDTLRVTRLRSDTLRTYLRDRNGNPSMRLPFLAPGFATSTDTTVATVRTVDSAQYQNWHVVVTARRPGTARIIVTANAHADTGATVKLADTTVYVVSPVVAGVAIGTDSALLAVGDRVQLTAAVRDSAGTSIPGAVVTWSSTDLDTVRVDSVGVVTGIGAGVARVVATAGEAADTVVIVVRDFAVVYVDAAYTGTSTGSASQPYRTVTEGVANVPVGGVVRVRAGNYVLSQALVIDKRLRLWGDGAASTILRSASTTDDAVRVATPDSVEIRGLRITKAGAHGVYAVGAGGIGPRLVLTEVVVDSSTRRGLNIGTGTALTVLNSTIRANRDEGIRLTGTEAGSRLVDVTVTGNSGNGIVLSRAQAAFERVTVGTTTYRNDSRSCDACAIAARDSSVFTVSHGTVRADNAQTWGVWLESAARLTRMDSSQVLTWLHLNVSGNAGVDSLIGNTFSSSNDWWWCGSATEISSARRSQRTMLIQGNTFDVRRNPVRVIAPDSLAVTFVGNTVRGSGGGCGEAATARFDWGASAVTLRENRFVQDYYQDPNPLLRAVGRGPLAVARNVFEATNGYAAWFNDLASARVDSNDVTLTQGGAGLWVSGTNWSDGPPRLRFRANRLAATAPAHWAMYFAWTDSTIAVGNRFTGAWQRAVYTDGDALLLLRRNTVDSAQGGFDVSAPHFLADSNVIRDGQFGILLRHPACDTTTCVVTGNTLVGLSDYGVKALETSARVEATGNWWGASSGPRDEDASGFDANPSGGGVAAIDAASGAGRVRYRPWLALEAEGGSPLVAIGAAATVTVVEPATAPTLTSVGDTLHFRAQARDAQGALITAPTFQWSTSDAAVVTVDQANGTAVAVGNGTATVAAEVDGQSAGLLVTVRQAVATVVLAPDSATIAGLGSEQHFTATVRDARGVDVDTSLFGLTWTSSAPTVLGVPAATDASATASGLAFGNAWLRAAADNGTADSSAVFVSPSYTSVVLARDTASLGAVGDTVRFGVAVTDADGPVASPLLTWHTADGAVAEVDGAGLVTARGNGTTLLVASGGFRADTATVTVSQEAVSLAITSVSRPDTLDVDALSDTVALQAEVRDVHGVADPRQAVTWQALDTTVATAYASGAMVTRAEGATQLVATFGSLADTVWVVVRQLVAAVDVGPQGGNFPSLADTMTYTATPRDRMGEAVSGRTVAWESTDPAILTVDPSSGLVTTVANGTAEVRATVDGVTGTALTTVNQVGEALDVSPDTATIVVLGDASREFTATLRDARGQVVDPSRYTLEWNVLDGAVVSFDGEPGVTARVRSDAYGATYVLAVVTSGGPERRDSSRVVVTPVYGTVTVTRDTATLTALNDTVRLGATVTDTLGTTVGSPLLTWTSGDTTVARVNQNGRVRAWSEGTALITVSGGTRQDTATVTVRQAAVGVWPQEGFPQEFRAAGDTIRFSARAWDRNGYAIPRLDDSVRWRIDANDQNAAYVLRVDSVTGLVTALGYPPLQNWWCSSCYSYGLSLFATVSGQQWQTWANFYPRIHRVDVQPDTLRVTRLRTDTLRTYLRDRRGNASARLPFLAPGFATSTDTTVATVRTVDSAQYQNWHVAVTARRPGTTRIIVAANAHADTGATVKLADTTVYVVSPVVAGVAIGTDSALVSVGGSYALTVTAWDSGGTAIPGAAISWSSASSAVEVSAAGVVTGVDPGLASVIAASGGVADTAYVAVQSLNVVYVDANSTNPVQDGSVTGPFRTIAQGVSAAPAGGVVRVRAGTYRETVQLAKRLRLWGDSAAAVTIQPSESDDGISVTATDSVEIRGVTVTGAAYNGISVVGGLSGGPLATIADVVLRNNTGVGLYVARASALTVRNSVFRANATEGVRIQDVAETAALSDIVVDSNAGNGIVLQRARANLARVTIGRTRYRSNDSREYNGVPLGVYDTSTVRVTGSTFRSDNYNTFAIALARGSRMPLVGSSTFGTWYDLQATSGSGVDSIVDNVFTSTADDCCQAAFYVAASHPAQSAILVRGNTFDMRRPALQLDLDGIAVEMIGNTVRGGYYPVRLNWGSGTLTLRQNRIVEAYYSGGHRQVQANGSGTLTAVGNEFVTQTTHALWVWNADSLRADSNTFRSTGPSGYAVYVSSNNGVAIRFNRLTGRWGRAVYTDGSGRFALRRNTVDSAQGGFDLSGSQVRVDSNSIRAGQTGVLLRDGGCVTTGCIVAYNSFVALSDFGVQAATGAQVDARNNWWGSASGPRDQDATGFGFNPTGTGVRVYDGTSSVGQVRYEPWLTAEAEGGSPLVPVGAVSTVVIVSPSSAPTLTSVGDTLRYTAQARDGSGTLISGAAFVWRSSDLAVARVDSVTGLVTTTGNGSATITADAGGQSGSRGVNVQQAVATVNVTPDTATLAGVGQNRAFTAVARDARGTPIDSSRYALSWSSTAPSVATVGSTSDVGATATSADFGVAYVKAVAGNGAADSSRVVVTPTYLTVVVAPDAATLGAVGEQVQLGATVTDGSGPVASPLLTWTTSDTAMAVVDQTGLVTARGNGQARIVVSGGFQADTATITVSQSAVSVAITTVTRADTLDVDAVFDTLQVHAEVRDAGGAPVPGLAVSWQSLDTSVARVSAAGQLVTRAQGAARLVASYASLRDTIRVVVSQVVTQVAVTPSSRAFASLTDTLTFQATARDRKGTVVAGRPVAWSSADPAVAAVDAGTGRVTTATNGSTTLQALVDGVPATANVVVSQVMASVDVQPDTATIVLLDDTSKVFTVVARDARGVALDTAAYSVSWAVLSTSVAALQGTPSKSARVRSVGYGGTYIRAIVTAPSAPTRRDSSRILVTAVYGTVALARDTATLVALQDTIRLSASATDTLGNPVGSPLLAWTTSDTSVATVTQLGTVRAQREGEVLVTVSGGTRQDTATVTVRQVATGVRAAWNIPWPVWTAYGDSVRLAAEAYDRNNYAIPRLADSIRWRLDNSTQRVDSVTGWAWPVSRNWYGDPNGGSCVYLRVGYVENGCWSLWFQPQVHRVELGLDTLRATRLRADTVATFFRDRNGYRAQNLTSMQNAASIGYTLVSTDTNVVRVAALDSTRIVLTGRRPGLARVILRVNVLQDTLSNRKIADTLTVVVDPVVATLLVSPDSTLLAVGDRVPLTAAARDSGGTVIPGQRVTWSSGDEAVVTVDTLGVATGVAVGVTTVTATSGGVSTQVRVAVEALTVAYVDAAYTGSTHTGNATEPFTNISDAVAAVAEGGVVRVRAGIYSGTVVIDKRLRLWGDDAATTIIRASVSDDGIRVATADTVEIRRVSVLGPASGQNYDGINAVGDGTTGVRLRLTDVVVRNQSGRGMNAVRPVSLVVTNAVFRNNGQEGARLLRAANAVQLTDVTFQANAGNGLLLQRSVATLTRVTVNGTSVRSGDSRPWNGTAVATLDSSTVRATNLVLGSDNSPGRYGLVLDNGSRMPLLASSTLNSTYHLWVNNGAGVDSIVGSRFSHTATGWDWGGEWFSRIQSVRSGQPALLLQGNVFDGARWGLLVELGAGTPITLQGNTFWSEYKPAEVHAYWGNAVTIRDNQFVQRTPQAWGGDRQLIVHGNWSGAAITATGNSFTARDADALFLEAVASVVADSNSLVASASPGIGIHVNTDATATVRSNVIQGGWAQAMSLQGGPATVRRNTIDGARGGLDLGTSVFTVDSNIVRNGQYGVQEWTANCTLANCVVAWNSFTSLTDFGVKAYAGSQIQAVDNWWGSASGPRDDDDSGLDVNFAGTGVRVIDGTSGVGQVAYRTWLTSAPAGIGAPGVAAAPIVARLLTLPQVDTGPSSQPR